VHRPPLRLLLPIASALLALILVLVIALSADPKGPAGDFGTSNGSRPVGGFYGTVLPSAVPAPGFTLTDQSGHVTALSAYRGRVVVLVFLDSSCRACMLVAQQVRGALDELAGTEGGSKTATAGSSQGGSKTTAAGSSQGASTSSVHGVQTIFVSTEPKIDTPARVSRFLAEASLSGRVEYLSGAPARLRSVWRAYRIPPAVGNEAASAAQPATSVLLIDRDGIERVEIGLEQLTLEGLAHDIETLLDG
jgi:cytochrome oxidase Cu insertion factor (SCO1/SenC/PrrC family)